jgi:type IV pilus assembly protein PilE
VNYSSQSGVVAKRGFTLIELLITVAVVGILAAIAYPSYVEQVKRSNRADARAALLENAQFLERNFTEANRYDKDASNNDVTLPIGSSPRTGAALYNISASTLTSSSFTLTASPISGERMDGDGCGSLTLNNLGVKGLSGASSGYDVERCWQR